MLTQLRIQNFKAWQDTGDIRLAPLTVFFGTNSSGKTSLLQFLLMLKQTVQSHDRKRVLNFGNSRSLVNLGVWPEMVFRRDPNRTLQFELQWQRVDQSMRYGSGQEVDLQEHFTFEAKIGALPNEQAPIGLKEFRYRHSPVARQSYALGVQHTNNEHYEFWVDDRSTPKTPHEQLTTSELIHFHGFRLSEPSINDKSFRATELQFRFEQKMDSIRHLGPLRIRPSPLYAWAGDIPEDVGTQGEKTVEALLASRERRFKPSIPQIEVGFEVLVAQWLQQMGILEAFEVRPIAPHRKEYEVFVQAAGTKDAVNLTAVGFGVSQVLPVLVQLLYVERRSTLIFEQPELHLHPRAQSALADVFIDALGMKEEGKERKIQLLVESHSEHFLRRLQRRVAEEKLSPEQVALYFCKPSPDGSIIEELKLDEYGNISNWPENFFGDEVGDLAAMTEAAMKRQLGSEGK
jgi:predicted ATPase